MTAPVHPPGTRRPERLTIDVSGLPGTTFGRRSTTWWGTVGFMVIEGTTLVVAAASLLYLRGNFETWPPRPVLPPDLGIPTLVLLLLLVKLVPAWLCLKAAKALDRRATRRWLVVALVVGLAATALRLLEFESLNVRWDTNAYGSAVWAVLGIHTFLLAFDVLEVAALVLLYSNDARFRPKHFPHAEDSSIYEFFLSLSWVPLYLLVYLLPRF